VTEHAVISVPSNVLEAVAKWTGTDEVRPHLRQVLFTKGTMVAVDGHRMVIVPCETFGLTVGIGRQYVLAAVAAQRALKVDQLTIAPVVADGMVRLGLDPKHPRISILVPAADTDKFPPYERMMRDSERAEGPESPAGHRINPSHLAAIAEVDAATCDASEILDRGVKVTAWSRDRLGAMVFENMAGVKFLIMPMRI
jgi:hypothetical protein